MAVLAFSLGGVSTSLMAFGGSSRFGQFAVFDNNQLQSLVTISQEGDEIFGSMSNRVLHYGWMGCCTTAGGEDMIPDPEGRAFPHSLLFKHISIKVDCGRIFAGSGREKVNLEISEGRGRQKGPTIYKVEDYEMSIWSGQMANDAEMRGYGDIIEGDTPMVQQVSQNLLNGTTFEQDE